MGSKLAQSRLMRRTKSQLIDEVADLQRQLAALNSKTGRLPQSTPSPVTSTAREVDGNHQLISERFNLALWAADSAIWDWDIEQNLIWNSRGIQRLFGRGEDDITEKFELENDASPWVSQLHPDDRARVLQSIQDHLESDTPYDVDYRYRMPDGEYIWVHSIGRAIRSANGRPLRMVGSDSEITTRKQAEAVLRERDARHATAADLSQDLIWIFTDGIIVECNDYAAHALGLKSQEELVGRSVLSLLHPGDHEIAKIRFAQLLEGRSRHAEPENTPHSA